MSVIFGMYREHGPRLTLETFAQYASATEHYGQDATALDVSHPIAMAFQAFNTSSRSSLERQPAKDAHGNILTFDGRLDNHDELAASENVRAGLISDSDLILKTFVRWGDGCFSRMVGDWAVALWSAVDRVLYLARDHAGSRTLFYTRTNSAVIWSTYLETFSSMGIDPEIEKEYLARVLTGEPIRDLTPTKGIRAVPPAHYIAFRKGGMSVNPHWHWIAKKRIIYRSDAEYDDHFLYLLRQSLTRRDDPTTPTVAELSGGMDSTGIVCTADKLAEEQDRPQSLSTVSYYLEDERDWDERPYFTAVDHNRQLPGIHINLTGITPTYRALERPWYSYPYPIGDAVALRRDELFQRNVGPGRFRVILSGIGGDELLGGVPTPLPELADYLREGQFLELLRRSTSWCVVGRQPLFKMLYQTINFTKALYLGQRTRLIDLPPWLSSDALQIWKHLDDRQTSLYESISSRPSALANGNAWWSVLEGLQHLSPRLLGCYEYRYPYLDRDLVDFLHQIPRVQLLQPGRRRALMRRALKNTVPTVILERRRKAVVSRGPITQMRASQKTIEDLLSNAVLLNYGMVHRERLLKIFREELSGRLKWIGYLRKVIELELALKRFTSRSHSSDVNGVLERSTNSARH